MIQQSGIKEASVIAIWCSMIFLFQSMFVWTDCKSCWWTHSEIVTVQSEGLQRPESKVGNPLCCWEYCGLGAKLLVAGCWVACGHLEFGYPAGIVPMVFMCTTVCWLKLMHVQPLQHSQLETYLLPLPENVVASTFFFELQNMQRSFTKLRPRLKTELKQICFLFPGCSLKFFGSVNVFSSC